jgi:diguanylate cyclase (GGDEF)-like protein
MEADLVALHSLLTLVAAVFVIKTLWPFHDLPGARVFFAFIVTTALLSLAAIIVRAFPVFAADPRISPLHQWWRAVLPLVGTALILEIHAAPRWLYKHALVWKWLLLPVSVVLPLFGLLLPIGFQPFIVGGWLCFAAAVALHLMRICGPLPGVYQRQIMRLSIAVLLAATGLIFAFEQDRLKDVTPFAAIFFALSIGDMLSEEQHAVKRLSKHASAGLHRTAAAWFVLDKSGRLLDLDVDSLKRLGQNRSQVLGQPIRRFFPSAANSWEKMLSEDRQVANCEWSEIDSPGSHKITLHDCDDLTSIFAPRLLSFCANDLADNPSTPDNERSIINSLIQKVNLLEIALDATDHGILITDENARIVYRNSHLLRLLDMPDDALKSADKHWQETFARRVRDPERFMHFMNQILVQKIGETLDIFELGSGKLVECQTRSLEVSSKQSSVRLWWLADCTEQQRRERELQHLSMHDTLTGIYNRAFFERKLVQIRCCESYPVSMIMVDVDGLKRVNDDQGHPAGDDLLRQAAQILRQACRNEDIVVRLGGDEFAILLPNADASAAEQVMTRIQGLLNLHHIRRPEAAVSLSLGYAVARSMVEMENLHARADDRMYENRRQRRECRQ